MDDFLDVLDGPKRPEVAFATGPVSRDATKYALAALAGECDNIKAVAVGSGRNDQLNKSAVKMGGLVAAGAIDEHTVTVALGEADGGLDYKATRDTIRSGLSYGMQQARAIPELKTHLRAVPDASTSDDPFSSSFVTPSGPATTKVERTSWYPISIEDIIAGRSTTSPVPVFLARQDGHRLFYAGKINGLIGESESGKTWVALHTAQRALSEGQAVLFIDFEDTPETIIGRLRQLGATDSHLEKFAYMRPDEPLQFGTAEADLSAALSQYKPNLVILDGFNEALTLLGLEPLSNSDVTKFAQILLRRITATGAGLITIDHLGKTAAGRGALGAQAKRAIVDGCTLRVEAIQAFGRGQTGRLQLGVDKDRPGHVRGSASGNNAGIVVLAAQADEDLIIVTVEAPTTQTASQGDGWRPTVLMERACRHLEEVGGSDTMNLTAAAIGGRKQYALKALRALATEGHITIEDGVNGSKVMCTIVNPYRQTADPASSEYQDTASTGGAA